jgi:diacylglycerol kinase family enzyme
LRAVIIVNPLAGPVADGWYRAVDLLSSHGWQIEQVVAKDGAQMSAAAQQAIEGGAPVIIAAGGDGTVSAVAGVVAGTDAVLGIIPTGTLNHFARDLQIPLNAREAALVLLKGNIGKVDVGEVNGRRFINNSSLGLYPSIVHYRESREKTGWSRLLAFGAGCVVALRRYRFLRLRMEIDGKVFTRRSPFLFVGNNRYDMEGLRLGRRKRLDEGKLSLYLSDRTGRLGLLRIAVAALLRRLRLQHDLVVLPAEAVIVQAHRKRVQVALDGEVMKMHLPLRYTILPGLLRVFRP